MFNKRRSEIQIIETILDLTKNGAKKTEILYQSNTSFSQLQSYLSFLIEHNMIKENIQETEGKSSRKLYVTTDKGNSLLKDINNLYTYFK